MLLDTQEKHVGGWWEQMMLIENRFVGWMTMGIELDSDTKFDVGHQLN